MRVPAVDDQVDLIERRREELLVALEFQRLRHHAARIRQHAVGGHDDITVDAEGRAQRCRDREDYSEIVCTTLDTGRELTVGSLASFKTSSSYCAMV